MASEQQGPRLERAPIAPPMRKRLQQCFEHAAKQASQDNYKYAVELLTQCVNGDPGNMLYVRNYIEALQKLYGNNRKGAVLANLKELGSRRALKKVMSENNWDEALKNGFKILAVNPWEVSVLRSMATASSRMGDGECELYYLKCALEANSKDPETNKQCGRALADRRQFDQAIACWHRVEQALPDDEEAKRAISDLSIRKNVDKGGLDTVKDKPATKAAQQAAQQQKEQEEISAEQDMKRGIALHPKDLPLYLQLAQFYVNAERLQDAEAVYVKAIQMAGGDADVREKLEDVQIRQLRQKTAAAQQNRGKGEAQEQEYRRLRKQLNDKELEICLHRVERYPNNLRFKYDLGVIYQIGRQYGEAIKQFQLARNDPRCKGLCMLGLGQCFQMIKQTGLAMKHYEWAIEEIPDREAEQKQNALYLAGKLAMDDMKDLDLAEKYLTTLAGMDFTYKDVSALLDKIAKLRDNQGSGDGGTG